MKQIEIQLTPKERGFHLITQEIENSIPHLPQIGLLHLFIQHTSAALTINENADPSVRVDFENWFNNNVRENEPYFTHTYEGPDDMPAHIKSSLIGQNLTIPVKNGRLHLGTWQGIYLCEFRNSGGRRRIVATTQG
ncbi:MAG: secondary thiamine-phosphate synthase enzyme YjbQ [Salibacteraceae bacterium]